jgi:hypothetical protein
MLRQRRTQRIKTRPPQLAQNRHRSRPLAFSHLPISVLIPAALTIALEINTRRHRPAAIPSSADTLPFSALAYF